MNRRDTGPSRRDLLVAGLCGLTAGCSSDPRARATDNATATGGVGGRPRSRGTPASRPVDLSDMELVLEDTFTASRLDRSRWRDKYPWNARTHNYDGYAAPENAYVEDGRLVLRAEAEARGGKQFTTGVVSAREVFSAGYFEASIRVPPPVDGFWPAYWLTSASEHPPEFDIFEFYGGTPEAKMSYHFIGEDGAEERARGTYTGPDFSADFHTYSLDWDPPEKVVWYIDGVERFRYEDTPVSDEYCWLILNFGIDPPWGATPEPRHLPATYEVDWIRCWER